MLEQDLDTVETFAQVLLIEDEPAHAQLIKRSIRDHVGEIQHVSTGREGLSAIVNEIHDLVLCDLNLPDLSGIEVIKEIRKLRPTLPIIIFTSSSRIDDAVLAMREGAWDFMVKQLSQDLPTQLRLVIERTARRKLQVKQESALRFERAAFSLAALTARDALAILSVDGTIIFTNDAFNNFASLVDPRQSSADKRLVVDLIANKNFTVARSLHQELSGEASSAVWSAELEVRHEAVDGKTPSHFFELILNTVSAVEPRTFTELESLASSFRFRVLWVRDITRRKEQERFQRDLLSTTTHDLKGPLGAILTCADLLSSTSYQGNGRSLDLLTRIASCARNSITIIDELLSARRIQDGVLVVRPNWHMVSELVEDTVLDFVPMALSKGLAFTAKPVEEGLRIFADRMSVLRVLGNLVSNAIKFTPSGGVVEISAERGNSSVVISVRDTGPGIDLQLQHKLFERYARLEQDQQIDGTGLGLFVTKNILGAHGGTVELKSQLGVGSTFSVIFPNERIALPAFDSESEVVSLEPEIAEQP